MLSILWRETSISLRFFGLFCGHVWQGLKDTWAGVLKEQAEGRRGNPGKKHSIPEGLLVPRKEPNRTLRLGYHGKVKRG